MKKSAFPSLSFNKRNKTESLARSVSRRLILLLLIPLALMTAAIYWGTRNMLYSQVVNQMQSLVKTQVGDAEDAVKARQIRLDAMAGREDFRAAVQTILGAATNSAEFASARDQATVIFSKFNREQDHPTFNLFLILDRQGRVLVSDEKDWEGQSLADLQRYAFLLEADKQSYGIFDLAPFYPDKFSLVTVQQVHAADNTVLATILGISEEKTSAAILQPLVKLFSSSRAYFKTDYGGAIELDPYTGALRNFTAAPEQTEILKDAFASSKEAATTEVAPILARYRNEKGEPVFAQAVWLQALQTGVVLEVTEEYIFEPLNNLLIFTAIFIVLTGIVLFLFIRTGTDRLVKPILSLSRTTTQFAEGNWEERAAIQSNDEIGGLASSFNNMADQLSELYRSLREQVEERTRQIRTAAEVAQGLTSTFNLDELLQKTVQLIVERFGFYHAGIFMLDAGGNYASLRAAHGPSAAEMLRRGHQLRIGSASIIGWVVANRMPRVASDVDQDPIHQRNELLPQTRAEAGIPIVLGGVLLGVLDVQSTEPRTFDEEMVIVLQTLANQIAAAIQNTTLSNSASLNLPEAEQLYRAAAQIAQSTTEADVMEAAASALKEVPHPSILLKVGDKSVEIAAAHQPGRGAIEDRTGFADTRALRPVELARHISGPMLVSDLRKAENLPSGLAGLLRKFGCQSGAFMPIRVHDRMAALLLLGEQPAQPLTSQSVRPYTAVTHQIGAALEKAQALRKMQDRLEELEALASFNQTILSTSDLNIFHSTLLEQVQRVIGNYSFVIAMYDAKTNAISIPYLYEEGKIQTIEPFPLGEGLTSILIHTRKPLLLVEDTEKQALALGAKIHGKPAKSWMGVPLLIEGEPIGALILQDLEREHCFDERDLHFLEELAKQMAGVLYNLRLLEQSRRSTLQLQTAAEIARDISGSLNLDELLLRAVNLIRDRFDFYHASVFLLDLHNEFAVIREATGDAGAQLKRMGHKLAVGSQSIVGYVTGRGETLVVNDTLKDATYFANPVLPETRAEVAIPLKVGERILGVLDVQSNQPYAFHEDNLRTLEILADQLAVAVVNTELFADTQEHLSQHRLLHHITTSAASGTTLEEALETTVKGLQVILGGDRVSILMLDREQKTLSMRASVGYSEEVANLRIPLGTGITGWASAHRHPLRVDDVLNDSRYVAGSPNTRSELAIPLLYRGEILGVLNVESEQVAAYTENDEEMLGTLGGSLAAIIANARLLEQIRRQAERERLLYEITSKIRRSTDVQTILATTASELSRTLGTRRTQIKIESGGDGERETEDSPAKA